MSPVIGLQLLGGLEITAPDLPAAARARRRQPLVLLAVVAAAAPQPVTRDRLMALLWPESDADRASNSLRQTLHTLRHDLGDDLFLPESAGGIRLDQEKLRVDLWEFRAAAARKAYAEADALHRGAFLDGVHVPQLAELARWIDGVRASVEHEYMSVLESAAEASEHAGDWADAVVWRRRHATADPCSSRAALGLLRALAAAGDRSGALSFAAVHENFLRAHLDVEPEPSIAEFVAQLRQATPAAGMVAAEARARDAAPDAPVPVLASPAPGARSNAVAAPRPLRALRRRSRMFAIGAGAIGLVGVGATYSIVRPADPEQVLASGSFNVAGRDTADILVACSGTGCPAGPLPQPAFVVPTHEAYAVPAEGSAYIAPVANGTTVKDPGYTCCTTAVFERDFVLPPDAAGGIITVGVLADNQATVAINGVEFGRQPRVTKEGNFAGRPSMFATSFLPDPSGVNRLRVTLWDWGGVLGLNFRAFVRYTRPNRADSGGH